jgi:hypothetical protein
MLFLLPIVVQSLHFLWHPAHVHCCAAACAAAAPTADIFSFKTSGTERHEQCYICSFRISLQDEVLTFLSVYKNRVAAVFFYCHISQFIESSVQSLTNPRAPPFIV